MCVYVRHKSVNIYIYIYICIIMYIRWSTVAEVDPKDPFSISFISRWRKRRYSFPWIATFTLDPFLIRRVLRKEASSTVFWVFSMTRLGIETRSPRSLANANHYTNGSAQYVYLCTFFTHMYKYTHAKLGSICDVKSDRHIKENEKKMRR